MTYADPYWTKSKDPDAYKNMSGVKADNKIYHAALMQAKKDWTRLHAPMEPGCGLDGRPLQKGKRYVANGR
jgi:hypothetical protein